MKLLMERWRQYAEEDDRLDEAPVTLGSLGKAAKNIATGKVGQVARDVTGGEKTVDQIFGSDFDPEVNTTGDLKKVIQAMRSAAAGEEVGKLAWNTLLDLMPGLGQIKAVGATAKSSADAIKKIYGAGEVKTNTNLDLMQMEPAISKIVDDPVEIKYLNDLIDRIGDDDTTRLSQFLTGGTIETDLQRWLADNFDSFTIKR